MLGSGKVFTKIDFRWAYHLLWVHNGHKYRTAFRTRYGLFEWLIMPFGLTNAPSAFQHFINDVLSDFVDQFCVIYLNDILIYLPDQEAHNGHVRRVLKRLREYSLLAKASKCKFDQPKVEYLGFRVSTEGIKPDPGKVQTIHDWPAPKTVKQVQSFLGFANFYQRFVPRYSKIAHPLIQLTKKDVPWEWSDACNAGFTTLKTAFTSDGLWKRTRPATPWGQSPHKLGMTESCGQWRLS